VWLSGLETDLAIGTLSRLVSSVRHWPVRLMSVSIRELNAVCWRSKLPNAVTRKDLQVVEGTRRVLSCFMVKLAEFASFS